MSKNNICLWYNKDAEEAARFYANTFPDSNVGAIIRAPGNYPSGEEGDVLVVEFTVAGVSCIGLNGGPIFKHSEAFSFQISTAANAVGARINGVCPGKSHLAPSPTRSQQAAQKPSVRSTQ